MYYLDNKLWTSVLHYVSVLLGPILACAFASLICLVPAYNVMEQPQYWFEEQFIRFLAVMPILMGQILVIATYWSEFSFDRKWLSYSFLVGWGCLVYELALIGYYFIWTYVLGFSQPMGLGFYFPGAISCVGASAGIWIR